MSNNNNRLISITYAFSDKSSPIGRFFLTDLA